MRSFKITLKNYRCFEDTRPLTLELGPGFTAFVGPNNSGKSSCLKFFYESRQLFGQLANQGNFPNYLVGHTINAQSMSVDDQVEIFFNRNQRPLVVEIEFPAATGAQVSKVRLTTKRTTLNSWQCEFFTGMPPTKLMGHQGGNVYTNEQGQQVVADFSDLVEMAGVFVRTAYVGPFRNAINEGSGTYYDLGIGTTFIDTWDQWKTGPSRLQNEVIQAVTDDIAHVFGYSRFEVNAADSPRTSLVTSPYDNPPCCC